MASPAPTRGTRPPPSFISEPLITRDWVAAAEQARIDDAIAWKAPQPGLYHATRTRLERLWRLYPEIHDRALLISARIETRIRTANRT